MTTDQPTPVAVPAAPPGVPVKRTPFLERWGGLFHTIDLALPVGLLALAFLVAAFSVRNSDFWQHLAAGRLLAEGGYSFGVDPFGFNEPERYWVNHAWLFDLGSFALFSLGGGVAIVVAKALAVTGVIALINFQRPASQPAWVWALFATLALLALAPRLLMQPTILSFLFAAILMAVLVKMPAKVGSWRLPVVVAVVCALWANCDQWFFLGPVAVLLFWLGELGGRRIAKTDDAPSLNPLGIAAGLAFAATLLNPHHVNVWTLPAEVFSAEFARDLQDEPMFRDVMQTPFDPAFFRTGGNPLNPAAFYLLLLASAVGVGLNYAKARWGQVAVWLGAVVLAMVHARAIPFFAVVAAPLAAAMWCQLGAEFASRSRWAGGVAPGFGAGMRVATGLLGVVMLLMAWPGWLNHAAGVPAFARRVGFDIEPEPSFKRFGEQLIAWRQEGLLPEDVRGFHSHPEVGNYLAWFAPGEKTSFDGRFTFRAPDAVAYTEFRQALRDLVQSNDESSHKAIRRLMSERGLRYIVLHSNPLGRSDDIHFASRILWTDPAWAVWYMDGRTVMFGPRVEGEPKTPLDRKFAALAFDPVKAAFGADVSVPAPSELLPPADPGFVRRYMFPPPAVPLEVDEALMLDEYGEYRLQVAQIAANRYFDRVVATSMLAGPGALFGAKQPPEPPELAALPLLALRASRKAVAASPDNPDGYLTLAQAYRRMQMVPDVQELQALTALKRCKDRCPKPEQSTRAISLKPFIVSRQLMEARLQAGQLDLALEDLHAVIGYLEKAPPNQMDGKNIEAALKFFKDEIRWPTRGGLPPEELVRQQIVEYENATNRQKSVPARVLTARSRGLWGEAIADFRRASEDGSLVVDLPGRSHVLVGLDFVNMEMLTGNIEQAMFDFRGLVEKDGDVSINNIEDAQLQTLWGQDGAVQRLAMDLARSPASSLRTVARERWMLGLWLSGDYERAAQEMDVMIKSQPLNTTPELVKELANTSPETIRRVAAQSLIGLSGQWPTNEFLSVRELVAVSEKLALRRILVQEGELHVRRAFLALEAGDNTGARRHFTEALKPHGVEIVFPAQGLAREYLRVMGK